MAFRAWDYQCYRKFLISLSSIVSIISLAVSPKQHRRIKLLDDLKKKLNCAYSPDSYTVCAISLLSAWSPVICLILVNCISNCDGKNSYRNRIRNRLSDWIGDEDKNWNKCLLLSLNRRLDNTVLQDSAAVLVTDGRGPITLITTTTG